MNAREKFEKLGYAFRKIFYDDDSSYAYEYSCGGKRFIFQDLDEKGIVTDSVKYISWDELQAFIQQINELGWLEGKQAIKSETNLEHYLNDLLKIGRHFCFMHGKVKDCCDVECGFCTFGKGNCDKERFKWLASPHKKPTYKLSQFEYDLISTYDGCHEACKFSDCRQLRGLKEKGYFKSVDANTPVHEILDNCEVIE